ncbi:MAG: succinate--CoA ligase subunit beta [bacterium]|nr:MAG: succinate--CoA ligase subunit beta [bacterium]
MKLREYQAKGIFAATGIPIPDGRVVKSVKEVVSLASEFKPPLILKPQLGFKGRGKLGIIAIADTPKEAASEAERLLSLTVKNERIERLLVEEKVDIAQELYLAVTIDYGQRCPVIMVSQRGGVDIEQQTKMDPHSLLKMPINILNGPTKEQFSQISEISSPEIARIAEKLYAIFREYDAEMVEINPLVKTTSGDFLAVDAVLNINDDSHFRHPELTSLKQELEVSDPIAEQASANNWTYIDLPGDIAILSSGAGLTMTILDLIHLAGGSAANFLDTAQIDGEGIYKAFQLLNSAKQAKAILVNIFAGLNQCDSLASGIHQYLTDHPVDIPIVIRMIGNKEEIGHKILTEIGIKPYTNLEEAIDQVVAISKKIDYK